MTDTVTLQSPMLALTIDEEGSLVICWSLEKRILKFLLGEDAYIPNGYVPALTFEAIK